ncbi:MAG: hypothetical protein KA314_02605 [Chloroflexi bacterium]|nr:hypothetical protein [Chloroflexota bacterium]MBP8054699.1 hypothetical protein [Chloroflexota bacterium]
MSEKGNHLLGISYGDNEPMPQQSSHSRQRTFLWLRLLTARPHKPARSDTDD